MSARRGRAARVLSGVAFAALVTGAGAERDGCGARRVPVAVVRAGSQCGAAAGPAVSLVTTVEGWRAAYASPALGGGDEAAPVDFAKDAVVLISMGERPTGGHAVELLRREAAVQDGVARVQVALRAPAKSALVTQALTRPCLALSVPREGIRAVEVLDERGAVVARTGR
jgi:protease stability complex PrcB-like protein